MKLDDPDSLKYDDKFDRLVWAYGKEIWCNMEGRYTHIVADWTGTPA